MSPSPAKKVCVYLIIILVVIVALGVFAAFGPPGLYAKSESPEFCASCHTMAPEYEDWFHAGAHRRAKCIDCHLPNDNLARHLFWKGVDGLKDFASFHTGWVSPTIKLSAHGAAVVQENCRRCHAETVARINEDRQCWFCHRQQNHKFTGAIQTP